MAISGVLWSLLGVLAGVFIVIQAPVNAHLTHGFGVPVAEPAISFLVGAIVLGVVNLLKTRTQSLVIDWKALVPGLFVTVGALGSVSGSRALASLRLDKGADARAALMKQGDAVFAERNVRVRDLFVGDYVASHQARFLNEVKNYLQVPGRLLLAP